MRMNKEYNMTEEGQKLEVYINEYLEFRDKAKAIDDKIESIKGTVAELMEQAGLSFFTCPSGRISKVEFEVDRVAKDKVEQLSEKSQEEPVSFSIYDALTTGYVSYYRISEPERPKQDR